MKSNDPGISDCPARIPVISCEYSSCGSPGPCHTLAGDCHNCTKGNRRVYPDWSDRAHARRLHHRVLPSRSVLQEIPVGIAYAVWSGIGIVFITLVAYVVYRQGLTSRLSPESSLSSRECLSSTCSRRVLFTDNEDQYGSDIIFIR